MRKQTTLHTQQAGGRKGERAHLGNGEGLRHVLQQLLQVVLHELHDHEHRVQGAAHHHLQVCVPSQLDI